MSAPRTAAPPGARVPPAPPETTAHDPVALWASAQVTALGVDHAPAYGSRAWSALPATDARRTVAILAAAEQWRRHTACEAWLDYLADTDPDRWFATVTAEASAYARTLAHGLARRPTLDELHTRRRTSTARPRPVVASRGWPPVAVPGRPGYRRHLRANGTQTDLPDNQHQEPPRAPAPPRHLHAARRGAAA